MAGLERESITGESGTGTLGERVAQALDPLSRARRRNEQAIAGIIIIAALIGIITLAWRIRTVESRQGWLMLVLSAVVGAGYVGVFLRRGAPYRGAAWFRSTLEVTVVTLVIFLDSRSGPDFLVSSSTAYMIPLAVVATTLRLDPRLTIYATILAIVEHGAVYLWGWRDGAPLNVAGPAFSIARLHQELWFRSAIIALIGALGTMLARTLKKEVALAAEEERLRTAFGSYVDRRVVRAVMAGDLRIAPARRVITVMFVDIRGFTAIAETQDPGPVFARLSATLEAFAIEVQKQGGLVNKFTGDGLMAIFGAPEEQPDHVRRAVRAALKIAAEAKRRHDDGRFPELVVGIGLHSGETVVGDLGGERREFTAIGDVVNVASRVEAANKELGSTILATRTIRDALGEQLEARKHPAVVLRGREAPVELYEVLALTRGELSGTGLQRVIAP